MSVSTELSPEPSETILQPNSRPRQPIIGQMAQTDRRNALVERILAQSFKHVLTSEEAGAIFNDVQFLMSPIADDIDIVDQFCDFSSYPEPSWRG